MHGHAHLHPHSQLVKFAAYLQFTAGIKAFGVNDAPAHAPQLTWIALERITEDHLYLHRPIEFGGETACTAAGEHADGRTLHWQPYASECASMHLPVDLC